MAKVGEGDERWIVSERQDGANVHGWHWQEKDCLAWAKERYGELLGGKVVCEDEGGLSVKLTKLTKCSGEAFVNIRKGKMIPSYELELRFGWEGTVKDGNGNVIASASGAVHLPYVAEENSDEDPEVKVSVSKEDAAGGRLKEVMLSKGRKVVYVAVAQWVKEMAAGGPGGKDAAPKAAVTAATAGSKPDSVKATVTEAVKPAAPLRSWEIDRRKVTFKSRFYCRAEDIYEALTDARRMMGYTMAPAESAPTQGGAFMMFGGSVTGTYEELAPPNKIVQQWRFSSWEEGVSSKVVITIEEMEPGDTHVRLEQTGLPEADKFGNEDVYDNTQRGWKENVFGRIRSVFGYGI